MPLFYKFLSTYDVLNDPDQECPRHRGRCPDYGIVWSQTLFSLAAWTVLAVVCARSFYTTGGRLVVWMGLLGMSLAPFVQRWDSFALSESFSLSLFILFFALCICFLRDRDPSWVPGIILIALLWSRARDTNSYVVLMVAGVILPALLTRVLRTRLWQRPGMLLTMLTRALLMRWWWRPRAQSRAASTWPYLALAALCLWFGGIFAVSNNSADRAERWVFPFYNVLGQRILPVPAYVAYFADHGMPVSPALLERRGKYASDDDSAFLNDPRLEELHAWTAHHGKRIYMKFLLTHPYYTLTAPITPQYFRGLGLELGLPSWVRDRSSVEWAIIVSVAIIVCAASGWWLTVKRQWRTWWSAYPWLTVPLAAILLSVPHLWLAWHGDAMGVTRHSVTALLQLVLGSVLVGGASVEYGMSRLWGNRRRSLRERRSSRLLRCPLP